MASKREKRRSEDRIGEAPRSSAPPGQGVGARQGAPAPSPQGGGYPDIRGVANASEAPDPALDDLRAMRLHPIWLDVAEAIGSEAFLVMWRVLDGHEERLGDGGMLELRMRPYKSYLYYQRNRYILWLGAQGRSVAEIQEHLRRDLHQELQRRQITRILGDG